MQKEKSRLLHLRETVGRYAVFSCCSSNEDVLRALMRKSRTYGCPVLIEATANQVNQYGGYSGKTPAQFKEWVLEMAASEGLEATDIVFGGDHLGPLVWSDLPADEAMDLAEELVRSFVAAGYEKIHLDTSMRLGSDNSNDPLSAATIAKRGARLCFACEEECQRLAEAGCAGAEPVYIIGSEVPVPGGATGAVSVDTSTPDGLRETIEAYDQAFGALGLSSAFERVVAIVVEMGVEFAPFKLSTYNSDSIAELAELAHTRMPFGFEAHSTDFQTRAALKAMCEDGAVVLKVGPAFTFALRESLFRLELIEQELVGQSRRSHFRSELDNAMLADDVHWKCHYGDASKAELARAFAFSDRTRYYMGKPTVQHAKQTLLRNLSATDIPLPLLSCYFPLQYQKIRNGLLSRNPEEIILDSIGTVIDDYMYATNNNSGGRSDG